MNCIRILALTSLAGAWIASGQHHDMDKCPMMQDHKMETRGDQAMGFSHEKTTHHFRLFEDGGAIEVEANDANDDASRDQIRQHLSHIAKMFAEGNFKPPMLIHDQTPPGVEIMQRRKGEIKYAYETTGRGARVRITTKNEDADSAIHDFLRFQISEHKTGDPTEIAPR
jgi:hypothetical protein